MSGLLPHELADEYVIEHVSEFGTFSHAKSASATCAFCDCDGIIGRELLDRLDREGKKWTNYQTDPASAYYSRLGREEHARLDAAGELVDVPSEPVTDEDAARQFAFEHCRAATSGRDDGVATCCKSCARAASAFFAATQAAHPEWPPHPRHVQRAETNPAKGASS